MVFEHSLCHHTTNPPHKAHVFHQRLNPILPNLAAWPLELLPCMCFLRTGHGCFRSHLGPNGSNQGRHKPPVKLGCKSRMQAVPLQVPAVLAAASEVQCSTNTHEASKQARNARARKSTQGKRSKRGKSEASEANKPKTPATQSCSDKSSKKVKELMCCLDTPAPVASPASSAPPEPPEPCVRPGRLACMAASTLPKNHDSSADSSNQAQALANLSQVQAQYTASTHHHSAPLPAIVSLALASLALALVERMDSWPSAAKLSMLDIRNMLFGGVLRTRARTHTHTHTHPRGSSGFDALPTSEHARDLPYMPQTSS